MEEKQQQGDSMLEKDQKLESSSSNKDEIVNLEAFSQMVGFPADLIHSELFGKESAKPENNELSLEDLRKAMVDYIDATMLD